MTTTNPTIQRLRHGLAALRDIHGFDVLFGFDPEDTHESELEAFETTREREDNSCCGTCASSFLGRDGQPVAYINSQHSYSEMQYIGFGVIEGDEAFVGSIVAGVMRDYGLRVVWNGTAADCVGVEAVDFDGGERASS